MKTINVISIVEGKISSTQLSIKNIIQLESSFVDVKNHLYKNDSGILIRLNHYHRNTTLNLSEISPYALLFFDDKLEYKGASYSIKKSNGEYIIKTQFKIILLIKTPHKLKITNITCIEY